MRKEIKEENVQELIELGTEITGSAAGGIIGFFAGGPVGAALGGAAGTVVSKSLKYVASEIKDRIISRRQEVRVGATLSYAIEKIQDNFAKGLSIRSDDFFTEDRTNRSSAEEIFEGVMVASQNEHEERKVQFYANLLGNIPFSQDVDRFEANLLIRLAKQLSYRQLCLLKLFVLSPQGLRDSDYRGGAGSFEYKHITILQEVCDLYNLNLLNASGEVLFGLTDVNPSKMKVQGEGARLYNLMELYKIPIEDLAEIIFYLSK